MDFVEFLLFLVFTSLDLIIIKNKLRRNDLGPHDDVHLTMEEKLAKFGYPCEAHHVTTADGYILKVYRVPHGPKCASEKIEKTPVLLIHGCLSSSNDFIAASTENSLGYVLPDSCFDTWITNSRGNFESTNHTHFNTSSREYWDFDWHEMGKFDVPAVIDYIIEKTGAEQIQAVGHSQGATQSLVYFSLYPEESERKVKSFHGLAPVAFLTLEHYPALSFISEHNTFVKRTLDHFGFYRLPKHRNTEIVFKLFCLHNISKMREFCRPVSRFYFGEDKEAVNSTLFETFLTIAPAGISLKQAAHYAQVAQSDKFQQYDYGTKKNKKVYGTPFPPEYNLSAIKVPIFLHYSHEDLMADERSVLKLAELTKTANLKKVNEKFGHMAFLYGNDVRKILYGGIIDQMKES